MDFRLSNNDLARKMQHKINCMKNRYLDPTSKVNSQYPAAFRAETARSFADLAITRCFSNRLRTLCSAIRENPPQSPLFPFGRKVHAVGMAKRTGRRIGLNARRRPCGGLDPRSRRRSGAPDGTGQKSDSFHRPSSAGPAGGPFHAEAGDMLDRPNLCRPPMFIRRCVTPLLALAAALSSGCVSLDERFHVPGRDPLMTFLGAEYATSGRLWPAAQLPDLPPMRTELIPDRHPSPGVPHIGWPPL